MIYTPKEAAAILKVCDRTVKNKLNEGTIKGFKIGNRWRISQKELDRIQEGK
jgi:excisionase family DNA binding protein